MRYLFVIFLVVALALPVFAQEAGQKKADVKPAFHVTDYPLPRFVTLGSDKIFVRAGPGAQYPIKWVYEKQGLPVEIILEFETWRKIKDINGQEGWVHQSLLSGKRAVILTGKENVAVRAKPEDEARLVAYMEPAVIATLEECRPSWCKVASGGYAGWVVRTSLWGVYPDENPGEK